MSNQFIILGLLGAAISLSACAPEPTPIYAEPVFDKYGNPECRPGNMPISGAYTVDLPICAVIGTLPVAVATPVVGKTLDDDQDMSAVAADPTATEPTNVAPVIPDPVTDEPDTTDPVVTPPVIDEPIDTDPVDEDPVVIDPVDDDQNVQDRDNDQVRGNNQDRDQDQTQGN